MTCTIEYDILFHKQIKKLDPQTRHRIRSFLRDRLLQLGNPRQTGSSLQGSELGNFWRYCVGDYRIICDSQDHKLVVIEIGHRRDVYR